MNRFIPPLSISGTSHGLISWLFCVLYIPLLDLSILSVAGSSKIICTSAVARATCAYVSLNIRQFAAQISFLVLKRWVKVGQSPSFPRIGREALIG